MSLGQRLTPMRQGIVNEKTAATRISTFETCHFRQNQHTDLISFTISATPEELSHDMHDWLCGSAKTRVRRKQQTLKPLYKSFAPSNRRLKHVGGFALVPIIWPAKHGLRAIRETRRKEPGLHIALG